VECVETHISWVFLAGDYAYKFKKPLDLGFLDFTERARRLHFCREELRLNGRLAPEIYLDVVGARPTPDGWRVGALVEGAEPAVRMRRFPAEARLDRVLDAGRLDAGVLEAFAGELARFQRALPPARPRSPGRRCRTSGRCRASHSTTQAVSAWMRSSDGHGRSPLRWQTASTRASRAASSARGTAICISATSSCCRDA